jgi:hypothetical protein
MILVLNKYFLFFYLFERHCEFIFCLQFSMILVMFCLIYTLNFFSFDWTPMPYCHLYKYVTSMFKLDTKNECNQVNKLKFVCFSIFFVSFEGFFPFDIIHKCQKNLNYKQLHLHCFTWPKMIYTILHSHISTCTYMFCN